MLALTLGFSAPAASDPGPDSVLATLIDGATGNGGYPGASQGMGPNSHILATGAVKMDGDQVVYLTNRYTGALIDTISVRDVEAYDDHINPAALSYPNGAFLFAATSHGTSNVLKCVYRAPDGTETAFDLTFADTLTYPRLHLENDGTTRLFIREGGTDWGYRACTDIHTSTSFSSRVNFADDADQLYVTLRYNSDLNLYRGVIGPNSSDPEFGGIRLIEFNPATGVFRDGVGNLALPFAYGDVAEFTSPTAGRQLQAIFDKDANALCLRDRLTADITDVDIYIWEFTGSDWFDEADWTKSGILFSDPGIMSAASGYNLGFSWATEPHEGHRFSVIRKVDYANAVLGSGVRSVYKLEQWDNPSGDLSTWDVTCMCRHTAQTSMISRPIYYENASDGHVPLVFTRFADFEDYNNYSLARLEWAAPWRGGEGINFEPEAQLHYARLTVASALYKNQLNAFYRGVTDLGLMPKMAMAHVAPTETQEQRETNLFADTVATSPSPPPFVARTGCAMTDPYFYQTNWIPGVDGGTGQNNISVMTFSSQNAQGGPSCGSGAGGAILINPRTAADLCQCRCFTTSNADTVASAESRGASGVRRAAAGAFSIYGATGGASNSKTRTSETPNGLQLIWGGQNNGSDLVTSFSGRTGEMGIYAMTAPDASSGNTPLDIHFETLLSLLVGETS